jgi:hypothetical protein
MKIPDSYLGDGVYLTSDGVSAILSTGSHKPEEWNNVVYMEEEVMHNLFNKLKEVYGVEFE